MEEEKEEKKKKKMEMEEEEEKKKKMEMEEEEELLSAPFEEVSPRPGYLASTTASTQRQMRALVYTKKEKQKTKPISAEEIANTEVSTEISSDGGGPGATTTTTATTVTPESDENIMGTVTSDDDDDASMESSENQSDIMGLDPDSMMASRKFSVQQQQNHLQIVLPAAVAAAENAYSYSRTNTLGLNGNNVLLQQADDAAAAAGQQIHRKSNYKYGSMSMLSPTAMYRQSMQQLREITQQRERSFLQEKSMYNSRGYHRYKCSSSSSSSSVCCSYVAVAGIGFLVICALLGLIALLIYVILRPQLPKVGIINVQIRQFNAAGGVGSGGNNAVLNLDMNFVVQCLNPNPRLGIDYLQLSILASFQNTSFPVTKVDPFFQVKRSAKLEVANLQVTNFAMASLDDGSALQTAIALNNIPLHAHIDVKAAVQSGSWQTPSFNINFACDLMVSPPSSPSTAGQLLGVVCLRTKDKIPLSLLNPVS
ncbi:hypothetical protein CY35_04G105600 [Sphagnum magellanicum]|nr:hypothetical protein CY35_04G105600 [Sphagnum magellanicum]